MADLPNDSNALRRVVNALNEAGGVKRNSLRSMVDALLAPAQNAAGFVSDPQSWQDMGRNLLGMVGSPLPNQQEAAAMMQRRRMQGSVMRDYPSVETDAANAYRDKMQALALGMNPVLATVWHGSPHKFDKFDMSKIGTGEGAQAYGHGLYFAENPKVAKEYSQLNPAGGQIPSPLRFVNGAEVQPGTGAYKAASLLDSMNINQARKMVNGWMQNARPEEAAYFKDVADTLAAIPGKSAVKMKEPGGNLYKVDLPDDQIAKMLDWDKPLSQQPAGEAAMKFLPEIAKPNMTGQQFHDAVIEKVFGSGKRATLDPNGAKIAATYLRDSLGIPGIRYLDGGSRGAGQGTSNFVVFDDRIPKILGRE